MNGRYENVPQDVIALRSSVVFIVIVVAPARCIEWLVPGLSSARTVPAGRDRDRNLASSPERSRGGKSAHQSAGERSGRNRRRP